MHEFGVCARPARLVDTSYRVQYELRAIHIELCERLKASPPIELNFKSLRIDCKINRIFN